MLYQTYLEIQNLIAHGEEAPFFPQNWASIRELIEHIKEHEASQDMINSTLGVLIEDGMKPLDAIIVVVTIIQILSCGKDRFFEPIPRFPNPLLPETTPPEIKREALLALRRKMDQAEIVWI